MLSFTTMFAGALTFGSWAYNGLGVNVSKRASASDISSYISNGEWELLGKYCLTRHVGLAISIGRICSI